jgi:hypothetical protein
MSVAGGRLDVARGTLRYGTSHVRTSFGSAAFRCRREADQIPERHGDDLALLSRHLHGRFVQRLGAVERAVRPGRRRSPQARGCGRRGP